MVTILLKKKIISLNRVNVFQQLVNKTNPKLKIKKDFSQIAKKTFIIKKTNKGKWIIIIVYSITIADTLLSKKGSNKTKLQ